MLLLGDNVKADAAECAHRGSEAHDIGLEAKLPELLQQRYHEKRIKMFYKNF